MVDTRLWGSLPVSSQTHVLSDETQAQTEGSEFIHRVLHY